MENKNALPHITHTQKYDMIQQAEDYRLKYYFSRYFNPDIIGHFIHPSDFVLIEVKSSYSYPIHKHDIRSEFIVCLEGKYDCTINGHQVTVKPNECILIQPGDTHSDNPGSSGLFLALSFWVTDWLGARYNEPILKNCSDSSIRLANIISDFQLSKLMDFALDARGKTAFFAKQEAFVLAELMIWKLLSQYREHISEIFSYDVANNLFVVKLRNLFHSNLCGNLTVEEMANVMGMGRRAFEQKCINTFGRSPAKAFRAVKLTHAAELLKAGRSSKQIALMLGFNNQFHFSRTFKDYFGVSASKFKLL